MNHIKTYLLILAMISSPLIGMDKKPAQQEDTYWQKGVTICPVSDYRKLYASINHTALEELASQPFIPATSDIGTMLPIGSEKPTTETPTDILADSIRYLPADIKARAFAHFSEKDRALKDRATIDDAADLAKLYQREAEQRLSKQKPDGKKD